jgi:IstB-like ATP binding protein
VTPIRRTVLLLDELGYLPIDKRGADLLFQVVAARYETGSIVLTTTRPFREWGALFDVDNTLATALIDRLMHHGEALVIQGDSYRMNDKDTDSTSARISVARPRPERVPFAGLSAPRPGYAPDCSPPRSVARPCVRRRDAASAILRLGSAGNRSRYSRL